jgi:hypothetical protein
MIRRALIVFLLAAGGSALADVHDTFAVLDLKIGMPIEGHAGFICAKQPSGQDLSDSHCVKFMDSRCKGRPLAIGEKRYSDKPPAGCFFDYSNQATYLDGVLQQTANTGDNSDPNQRNPRKPLMNVHIIGTPSRPSKIYWIRYTFTPDDLADDSKLYKALVAKYGEPTYKNQPGELRWARDTTKLKVECDPTRQCELQVDDDKLDDLERQKQQEADARTRHQNAEAPKL